MKNTKQDSAPNKPLSASKTPGMPPKGPAKPGQPAKQAPKSK